MTAPPSDTQRYTLYREIHTYLDDSSGVQLTDTIKMLRDIHATGWRRGGRITAFLAGWADDLEAGKSFAEIVRDTLPPLEASLIAALNKAARPGEGFAQAAQVGEQMMQMRQAFIGTLVIPGMLLSEMLGSFLYIGTTLGPMLPSLERSMGNATLPAATRGLIAFIGTTNTVLPVLAALLAAYGVMVALTLRSYSGRGRPYLDRLPPYTMFRRWNAAIAFMNLSTLLNSGEQLPRALYSVALNVPRPLRRDIDEIRNGVRSGQRLEHVMLGPGVANLLPAKYMTQVRVYAAKGTGVLEEKLPDLARRFLAESAGRANAISTTLAVLAMLTTVGLSLWINFAFLILSQAVNSMSM